MGLQFPPPGPPRVAVKRRSFEGVLAGWWADPNAVQLCDHRALGVAVTPALQVNEGNEVG